MPRFSPAALLANVQASLPSQASGAVCVAYSGGLDSTVLLHAMVRALGAAAAHPLRAIHVDHQLQPDAPRWREHCVRSAAALGVELDHRTVRVIVDPASGLEASARKARYEAFRALLRPSETLLLAHHADDQLETMLLALMRGAGLRGMGAMPAMRSFASGWLGRPLLPFTRAQLQDWAQAQGLGWIEDPSNESLGFDRNFVRHRILPVLRERWPAAAHSASRTARHLAEADRVLRSIAEADLAAARAGASLRMDAIEALDPDRRRNALRHWITRCGMRSPSSRKLAAIEHDMWSAAADRAPCIEWDDAQVRRHRRLLYCIRRQAPLPRSVLLDWQTTQPLELPAGLGTLRMTPVAQGGLAVAKLAPHLQVRFRVGGESLRPAGDAHHRPLKKLLQGRGVLPWWRDRLPLIYCAEQLIAVADLWIAQEFAAGDGEPGLRICWEGKPQIEAG